MTTAWGPAFDAEIDYRQQRARADYRHRLWHRRPQLSTSPRTPQKPPSAA